MFKKIFVKSKKSFVFFPSAPPPREGGWSILALKSYSFLFFSKLLELPFHLTPLKLKNIPPPRERRGGGEVYVFTPGAGERGIDTSYPPSLSKIQKKFFKRGKSHLSTSRKRKKFQAKRKLKKTTKFLFLEEVAFTGVLVN